MLVRLIRERSKLPWHIPLVYTLPRIMAKSKVAKLFRNGRSQAVRLPKEFRFEGDCVRVRQVAGGVLLEPIISDAAKWLAELRRLNIEPLLPKGRKQPRAPRRRIFA
jgi:antitoxin VapB